MKELRGKVAVVTGAASGIGRAVAGRCAAAGMKVVLADIEGAALEMAEKEIRADGAEALAVVTDVSKADDVDALAQRTLDAFGTVHVLHNNAGVATVGLLWDCTIADWEWLLGVNLWGVIHGVHTFVPIMLEHGEPGHIVNTASAAGLTSAAGLGPYNVTKHGVVTLSETLARDLALTQSSIKVSVLCPGFVNTGILTSNRNRPDALRNPGDERPIPPARVAQLMEGALAPEIVADQVLDAIRYERFYILTHPEVMEAIRGRMDDIVSGRTPQ